MLSPSWRRWLNPSKGVHILFDLKRLNVPGAVTMSHPEDGRIAFVIPRPDFGPGVTVVGTTDGPTPLEPEKAGIDPEDINYLLDLLNRYFPDLKLTRADVLSAYEGQRGAQALQKVSREHHIDVGPGGAVMVAGGKYTTHRTMAREIVDFTLESWPRDEKPQGLRKSSTHSPVNPMATEEALHQARASAASRGITVPEGLFTRYGGEALELLLAADSVSGTGGGTKGGAPVGASAAPAELEGFPMLEAQLRYCMRTGMVLHLEDFYFRRIPLFAARKDHGTSWAERLSQVWAEERGLGPSEAARELEQLQAEIARREV
jgi:glycerol-3-phosphate dehydrogenase